MDIIKRKFGIELEFSTAFDDLKPIVTNAINQVYGYKKIRSQRGVFKSIQKEKWTFKEDYSTVVELTSPVSTASDIHDIAKVLKLIKKSKKCKVTDKDGLHVHVEARDIPIDNLIAAWLQIEAVILKCFPSHRVKNSYCPRLVYARFKNRNIASVFQDAKVTASNHHSIISVDSMKSPKHTVEIRISEGTLDYKFLTAWLNICINFVNYASKIKLSEILCKKLDEIKTLDDMFVLLKINNKNTINVFKKRFRKFKKW